MFNKRCTFVLLSILVVVLLVGCSYENNEKKIVNNIKDNVILDITDVKYEFDETTISAVVKNNSKYSVIDTVFHVKNKKTNDVMLFMCYEGLNPGDVSGNVNEYVLDKIQKEDIEVFKADVRFMHNNKEYGVTIDYNTDTYMFY